MRSLVPSLASPVIFLTWHQTAGRGPVPENDARISLVKEVKSWNIKGRLETWVYRRLQTQIRCFVGTACRWLGRNHETCPNSHTVINLHALLQFPNISSFLCFHCELRMEDGLLCSWNVRIQKVISSGYQMCWSFMTYSFPVIIERTYWMLSEFL